MIEQIQQQSYRIEQSKMHEEFKICNRNQNNYAELFAQEISVRTRNKKFRDIQLLGS